jgi:hypothetical protein
MDFRNITEENFLLIATKVYDNPHCNSVDEFNEDLRRFSSVKRALLRINRNPEIEMKVLRLTLNHIIILSNLFTAQHIANLLAFYCDEKTLPQLKSFLLRLNLLQPGLLEFLQEDANLTKRLEILS